MSPRDTRCKTLTLKRKRRYLFRIANTGWKPSGRRLKRPRQPRICLRHSLRSPQLRRGKTLLSPHQSCTSPRDTRCKKQTLAVRHKRLLRIQNKLMLTKRHRQGYSVRRHTQRKHPMKPHPLTSCTSPWRKTCSVPLQKKKKFRKGKVNSQQARRD